MWQSKLNNTASAIDLAPNAFGVLYVSPVGERLSSYQAS
jgi:hypothetical protein